MRTRFSLWIMLFSLVITACGKASHTQRFIASTDVFNENNDIDSSDGENQSSSFKPEICSELDFNNISWPVGTDQITATLLALAMNITGSFEGHDGWDNISNNFDGQGVSLGLFNQNLGQGSLQPLLLKLRNQNVSKMRSLFTTAQFASIEAMIKKWNGGSLSTASSKATSASLDFYQNTISPLDDPALLEQAGELVTSSVAQKASSTRNQQSVDWAVQTVYTGSSFKSDWKKSLQSMANSPEYISLQVEAAKYIHNRAVAYMQKFGFKETRAYLFFFDIVVQNGSLTTSIENQYSTWAKSNTKATETAKLQKLLEYRLTLVRAEYVNDVRARKTAVITGTGTVHGSRRDFRNEYCAPSWGTLFVNKPTL